MISSTIAVLLLGLLGLLMFSSAPLFAVIGFVPVICFTFLTDVPLESMITNIIMVFGQPLIVALPIFTIMGYILNYGTTSQRLANVTDYLFAWLPGGLALSTIIAYVAFSAITGGSFIAIMTLGGIFYAALAAAGYDKKFRLGITTAMGAGGILLPPSLPIIVIGFLAVLPVDMLYVSAFIPCVAVIGLMMLYVIIHSAIKKIPPKKFVFKEAVKAVKDVAWEIPLPIIIVGGIFSGKLTLNEIAIVSLIYTVVVVTVIRREVKLKELKTASLDAMILIGALFTIMISAMSLSNFTIDYQVPQMMLTAFQSLLTTKYSFLMALNVFLLIVGCMMDIFSAILVFVPLLMPIAVGYGVDPVHFAIIFVWNLDIGFNTPPFGMNLFVGSFRFKEPLDQLWVAAIPVVCVQLVGLMVITYWPDLTLWLPQVLGYTRDIIAF